ncbi:cytochrome P450 [Mycena olivaceomarginata]|nr:cytochrome P450 [Mycena olivaceomarginata]
MAMPVVLYSFIAFTAALLLVSFRRRSAFWASATDAHEGLGAGPVMLLKVLGRSMVILDSHQAAVDLLDKKGAIYSDRPKFELYELLGWTSSLTFLQYGEKFNKHRQMHQTYLSRSKTEDFKPIQTQEARTLVQHLIESPREKYEKLMSRCVPSSVDFWQCLTSAKRLARFATGIITQIVAGHRISSDDDPYLRMSNMIYESFKNVGTPGRSPLDFSLSAWRSTVRELHDYPEHGEASPSFVQEHLERMEEGDDEDDLKGAAATMFAAGEATTWTTLSIFILAMILHPECQAKAQKEIDSVVGDLRLPEFGDRGSLPFVEGILQETLRWNPALPLGVPHRAMENNVYNGMLIPKGAVILANVRGMALDESVYSNPLSFHPERFLAKPAGTGEPHLNQVFGFGRRICTGQYVADNSLWIAIASVLATCTITNVLDESGQIIVPERTMTEGFGRTVARARWVISAHQHVGAMTWRIGGGELASALSP